MLVAFALTRMCVKQVLSDPIFKRDSSCPTKAINKHCLDLVLMAYHLDVVTLKIPPLKSFVLTTKVDNQFYWLLATWTL